MSNFEKKTVVRFEHNGNEDEEVAILLLKQWIEDVSKLNKLFKSFRRVFFTSIKS